MAFKFERLMYSKLAQLNLRTSAISLLQLLNLAEFFFFFFQNIHLIKLLIWWLVAGAVRVRVRYSGRATKVLHNSKLGILRFR